MGVLIDVVCDALCDVLKSCISQMTKNDFVEIANGFMEIWNFPNCIGAMDGKHIALKAPHKSGSMFFNYKVHCYIYKKKSDKLIIFFYKLAGLSLDRALCCCRPRI